MTAYERNETMRMLGYQCIEPYLTPEARKGLDDIVEARDCKRFWNLLFCLIIDVYSYGVIMGKRSEREKRARKKAVNPTTK